MNLKHSQALSELTESQNRINNVRDFIESGIEKDIKESTIDLNIEERLVKIKGWDDCLINTHSNVYKAYIKDGEKITEEVEQFYLERGKRKGFAVRLERENRKGAQFLRDLVLSSFDLVCPYVKETKVINNTIKYIRPENTIMRVKQIDMDKPFSLYNAKWNYIERGVRHWNHKLTNEEIEIIRNNLDMPFDDFIKIYGTFGVYPKTIKNVRNGKSWRVRVNSFYPMTYGEENFTNSLLINYLK